MTLLWLMSDVVPKADWMSAPASGIPAWPANATPSSNLPLNVSGIHFEPAGSRALKGVDDPVQTYAVAAG